MRNSLTYGRVAGVPLKVHINWFLTVILVAWSLASGYFPQQHPGWGMPVYWFVASVTTFLFFVSVLFHELGHALVALRHDVPVKSITLFIFGGVAHIAREPSTPRAEFLIVLAGPLVSLLLAALFKLFSNLAFLGPQFTSSALYLCQINVILAVFNLIPGFPLDGGRILRAFLWKLKANFYLATRWASHTGLGIAILFVIMGVAFIMMRNYVSGLWLAFIGWYLSTAAQEGYRQAVESDPTRPDPAFSEITRPRPSSSVDPQSLVVMDSNPALNAYRKSFALVRVVDQPESFLFAPGIRRPNHSRPDFSLPRE